MVTAGPPGGAGGAGAGAAGVLGRGLLLAPAADDGPTSPSPTRPSCSSSLMASTGTGYERVTHNRTAVTTATTYIPNSTRTEG